MENNPGSESCGGNGRGTDDTRWFLEWDTNTGISFHKRESLEKGTHAFMRWLNSEDKQSLSGENPIVLLKFTNDRCTIIYDTNLNTQLEIKINNGVPFCKYCKEDDCAHVGFAIEVEQLFGHRNCGEEGLKIEDIEI